MAAQDKTVSLPDRDFFGSRFRCLLLTHQPPAVVARRLTDLVEPFATIDSERDRWAPSGFSSPDEIELDKTGDFLSGSQQTVLKEWWLSVARSARTPTWDVVSTCMVDGRPGLMLVEAKAHVAEMASEGKSIPKTQNGLRNHDKVSAAIAESNTGLNAVIPGFSLTSESHYQLCNRFAWSWKIASMGIPVVLVYLGFLNSDDMAHRGLKTPDSPSAWKNAVLDYARNYVPEFAWDRKIDIAGTPVIPLIRSMDMRWLS